eukprot:gene23295-29507_t
MSDDTWLAPYFAVSGNGTYGGSNLQNCLADDSVYFKLLQTLNGHDGVDAIASAHYDTSTGIAISSAKYCSVTGERTVVSAVFVSFAFSHEKSKYRPQWNASVVRTKCHAKYCFSPSLAIVATTIKTKSVATFTKTSITYFAVFNQSAVYAGNMYCAAFLPSVKLTSVSQVATAGSGGRSWTSAVWTVTTSDNNIDTVALAAKLNSYKTNVQQLIQIPPSMLADTRYSISLTLANFMGLSSSTTVQVAVSFNPNFPTLSILGSTIVSIKPSAVLNIYASASLSSCALTKSVTYSWQLKLNNVVQTAIVSTSKDSKTYQLNGYSLTSQNVYEAVVTATVPAVGSYAAASASASVTIQVTKGNVVGVVIGGYTRSLAITPASPLVLDASKSYDEDSSSSSGLFYEWSCTYVSLSNYGESCTNAFGTQSLTMSSVSLTSALLLKANTYGIQVKVYTADLRQDSKVVSVQNLAPALSIKTRDTLNSVSTFFPAGSESLDYVFVITASAYDYYLASSSATTDITVSPSVNLNVTEYLTSALGTALSTGDNSLAVQTVNNVANTFNTQCSEDPSGNSLAPCLISDTRCVASCNCTDLYGGADCSLSPTEAISRDSDRSSLCDAIVSVSNSSNPSVTLLDSLIGSLLVSYSPKEVHSRVAVLKCNDALTVVSDLAASGLLVGFSSTSLNNLVLAASKFAISSHNATANDGSHLSASERLNELQAAVEAGRRLTLSEESELYNMQRFLDSDSVRYRDRDDDKVNLFTASLPAASVEDYSSTYKMIYSDDDALHNGNYDVNRHETYTAMEIDPIKYSPIEECERVASDSEALHSGENKFQSSTRAKNAKKNFKNATKTSTQSDKNVSAEEHENVDETQSETIIETVNAYLNEVMPDEIQSKTLNTALKTLYDKVDHDREVLHGEILATSPRSVVADKIHVDANTLKALKKQFLHNNLIASKVYMDTNSAEEETNTFIAEMKDYVEKHVKTTGLHEIPWQHTDVHTIAADNRFKTVCKVMGLNPDGSANKLTLRQRCMYGDLKSRILTKIQKARDGAVEIEEGFEE